jgi:hypothetical protein
MRYAVIALWMSLCPLTTANAQVSIGIGLPDLSIGFNVPSYPQLVPVPGYPVYYAPQLDSNYFFYDGMYWVYQNDNWYASSWYNGPWSLVGPEYVPLYVLRVPVRYYRRPPLYFGGWRSDFAPRWGEHWGSDWDRRHVGWDHWNRSSVPARAPLPVYQQQYSGNRYPRVDQQPVLQGRNYRYAPHETVVQEHYQQQGMREAPGVPARGHQSGNPGQPNSQQYTRPPAMAPGSPPVMRSAPPARNAEPVHGTAPMQMAPQAQGAPAQHERRAPQQAAAPQQPKPQMQTVPKVQSQAAPKVQSQSHEREGGGEHGQQEHK